MKKLLFVLLTLSVLFSCTKEVDPFVGTWVTVVPYSPSLTYEFFDGGDMCYSSPSVDRDCTLSWASNGTAVWIEGDGSRVTWTVRFLGPNTMQVYSRTDDSSFVKVFILERK